MADTPDERIARLEVRVGYVEDSLTKLDEMDIKLDGIILRLEHQKGFVHAVGVLWALLVGGIAAAYHFLKSL